MSLVKRVLAGIGVALVLLMGVGFVPASAGQPTEIEKSIALVGISWTGSVKYPADGKWYEAKATYLCTSWFASQQGHMVTAEHCVAQTEGVEVDLVEDFLGSFEQGSFTAAEITEAKKTWPVDDLKRTVSVVQPSNVKGAVVTKPTEVDVIDVDTDADHALLKLNGFENTPALRVATRPAKLGDEVSTYGFSADVTGMTDADTEGVTRTQGRVASVDKKVNGTPYIGVDMSVDNKMSGGPVLNAEEEALGVNSFGSDDGSADLNFGTSLDYLTRLLKRNSVELVSSSSGSEASASNKPSTDRPEGLSRAAEDEGSWPLWATIAVITAIVVLGGVLTPIVIRRRRTRHDNPVDQQSYSPPQATMNLPTAVCVNNPNHSVDPNAKFCGVCGARVEPPNSGVHGA